MATKDNFLLFKGKHKSFNYCLTDTGAQYSELNLNQNLKSSNIFSIQFNSKSYHNKKIDYTLSERYEKKEKSQTWKKSSKTDLCSKYSNSLSLNDENKQCWKKNGSLNATNNSTLSLRVSAYGNSNEASSDSLNNSFQKSLFIQKQNNHDPTFVSQSLFEFERQENDKVPEPEVSQFKASQRLLNPYKSDQYSDTDFVDILPKDLWDFAKPVDILPQLPNIFFEELIESKKWQDRKEALEGFLTLATENIKLDPKANYGEIVDTFSKILSKDANIYVCALAAKCITQLAKGLRTKFGPYAATFVPVIFEKFKEKKALLRDPLIEAIDAIYSTTSLDEICDPIAEALGKPNPNIKIQTNQFLYRVFKIFNAQTAPKNVIKTLTPLIAKCTGESDAEAREASFAALGAIMKAIGRNTAMTMLGDVASDKIKMGRIDKLYYQAVAQEGPQKAAPLHPQFVDPTNSFLNKESIPLAPAPAHSGQPVDSCFSVAKMLKSKNFNESINALDKMCTQLEHDPLGIINKRDLILKWATLRFFDPNRQLLIKTLKFCLKMFVKMEAQMIKLNDTDVSLFVPYLLLQSGVSNDIVQNLVKEIVLQIIICHDPTIIFQFILDALNTTKCYQKVVCMSFAETILSIHGLYIFKNLEEDLETIAECFNDSDPDIKESTMKCLALVWKKGGDKIYDMIENIPPKEKRMLAAKIKRMK